LTSVLLFSIVLSWGGRGDAHVWAWKAWPRTLTWSVFEVLCIERRPFLILSRFGVRRPSCRVRRDHGNRVYSLNPWRCFGLFLPGPVLSGSSCIERQTAGELSQRGPRRGCSPSSLLHRSWFNWQVLRPWFWGNIGESRRPYRGSIQRERDRISPTDGMNEGATVARLLRLV